MIAFLNHCNNTASTSASGSGNPVSCSWRKKRSKRNPRRRDYNVDEKLVAEALILLSQSAAADDAASGRDQPRTPSPDHEITIYQTVHNMVTIHGDEICNKPRSNRKLYKCNVCGEYFPTGQGLGGHKRKHFTGVIVRNVSAGKNTHITSFFAAATTTGIGGASSDAGEVVPNCPHRRRLNLDFNLPPEERRIDQVLKSGNPLQLHTYCRN